MNCNTIEFSTEKWPILLLIMSFTTISRMLYPRHQQLLPQSPHNLLNNKKKIVSQRLFICCYAAAEWNGTATWFGLSVVTYTPHKSVERSMSFVRFGTWSQALAPYNLPMACKFVVVVVLYYFCTKRLCTHAQLHKSPYVKQFLMRVIIAITNCNFHKRLEVNRKYAAKQATVVRLL